jgi:hypothetical protein
MMRRVTTAEDAELLRRIDEMPIHPSDRARARAAFLLAEALVERFASALERLRSVGRFFAGATAPRLPHGRGRDPAEGAVTPRRA